MNGASVSLKRFFSQSTYFFHRTATGECIANPNHWFVACFAVLFLTTSVAAPLSSDEVVPHLAEKLAFSNEGKVLQVKNDTLYLSLGRRDGIPDGSQFEVVRLGDVLKVGDEILGYDETIIGKAEAYRVREKITIARLLEKKEPPKAGDKVYQLKKRIKRVVLAQFQDGPGFNELTKSLQQRLSTDLITKGMQVVERDQLERVLREQKLGYSGLVNLASAKKIGQLLGAEGIVLGNISDMGDSIIISARLVDLEAGNSLAAAEASLANTPLIARLREARSEEDSSFHGIEPITPPTRKPKSITAEVKGMLFELIRCKRSGADTVCDFLVESTDGDKQIQFISGAKRGTPKSRLIDGNGVVHIGKKVEIGDCHSYACKTSLFEGVGSRVRIRFGEMKSENISLLQVCFTFGHYRRGHFSAKLQDFKLSN